MTLKVADDDERGASLGVARLESVVAVTRAANALAKASGDTDTGPADGESPTAPLRWFIK